MSWQQCYHHSVHYAADMGHCKKSQETKIGHAIKDAEAKIISYSIIGRSLSSKNRISILFFRSHARIYVVTFGMLEM